VVALLGAVIEPLLLRPFYRRAEEYQLLVTFGLMLILEDVGRIDSARSRTWRWIAGSQFSGFAVVW